MEQGRRWKRMAEKVEEGRLRLVEEEVESVEVEKRKV